jgi:hypothetical protein
MNKNEILTSSVQRGAISWTPEKLGFDLQQKENDFPILHSVTTEFGPNQALTEWGPGASFPEERRMGGKSNHSPLYSAKIINAWSCTSPYVFMAWCLIKHSDNFQ